MSSNKELSFSFAPIAGSHLSLNNTQALNLLSDLLFYEEANDLVKELFRKVVKNKIFFQQGEFTWLNIGYKTDIGFFSFMVSDNANVMLDLSGELSKFMIDNQFTNVALNKSQDFSAEAVHYREFSLGYAREIIENKLTLGIRGKLLFGKSLLSSNATGKITNINTDFIIESAGNIIISLPADTVMSGGRLTKLDPLSGYTVRDYALNTGNTGFAFDLGVNYSINPDWELSASFLNIGALNWNTYMHDLDINGNYLLDSNDFIVVNGQLRKTSEVSLEDELSNIFSFKDAKDLSYSSSLPATFILGVSYNYNDRIKLGVTNQLIKSENLYFNSLSLSANYKLNNKFVLSSGYSMHGNSLFNIPAAVLYNWHGGQAFLSIGNIFPFLSDFQGLSFGTSFYILGSKMKYDQIDYLPFYKHKKKRKTTSKGHIWEERKKNKQTQN